MASQEQQILLLSTLIQLEQQARRAKNPAEFSFVVVNETYRLLHYRQAIFWRHSAVGKVQVEAVSGLDRPDRNAPFLSYIKKLLIHINRQSWKKESRLIDPEELPEKLREGWDEWLNTFVLWCPLVTLDGDFPGGLLFIGEAQWEEAQVAVVSRLAEAYAHAWMALKGPRRSLVKRLTRSSRKGIVQLLLIVLVLFVFDQPVRLSALAPVEIVPSAPYLVSAPISGVISQFHVLPNQPVKKGDLLFSLDDTAMRNDYEVSRKGLAVVEAEYRRISQKSFADAQSRGEIRHLEAEIDRKKAEVAYMAELLKQSEIQAEQDGIVVFSEVGDWLGKPVVVGEKILTIADPARVEGDVWLPVEDAINLQKGAEVLLFLNIRPDRPIEAALRQASYEASITPEGILAFRLKVSLSTEQEVPRIGLRGTAKIYGKSVPFYYYLLRRPLTFLRQTLGI
ncbi:MAG: HlyD family efflux transporter periplasmic adaptor subunit [Desulfobulbaceae bacterium]|nr:HlyD family efflux transporter periplasmic adaptor subunit [Desulfobulbaceae bacterium]